MLQRHSFLLLDTAAVAGTATGSLTQSHETVASAVAAFLGESRIESRQLSVKYDKQTTDHTKNYARLDKHGFSSMEKQQKSSRWSQKPHL